MYEEIQQPNLDLIAAQVRVPRNKKHEVLKAQKSLLLKVPMGIRVLLRTLFMPRV